MNRPQGAAATKQPTRAWSAPLPNQPDTFKLFRSLSWDSKQSNMAVKKKPSRSKAVKAAVVAHALSDGKRKGKASLPSPTPSLVPSVCMAAVAFLGGLLTPPLLRAFPGAGGVRDSLRYARFRCAPCQRALLALVFTHKSFYDNMLYSSQSRRK